MSKKESQALEILHLDEHVVAVNKPAGVTVVPLRTGKEACLKQMVAEHMGKEVLAIHRLDRDTTGVVIFALDAASHRDLSIQFQNRRVEKIYWAVVRGTPMPPQGTINAWLARDKNPTQVIVSRHGGKRCRTDYRTLEVFRAYSLVEARPRTGRMHQIRVHLASIGNPLAVDPIYGGTTAVYLSEIKPKYKRKDTEEERPLISRLTLHAHSLTFTHPASRARLTIEAPLPRDFSLLMKQLSRHAALPPER